MTCQTNFFFRIEMGPTIFENWVIETKNWVMRIDKPNGPLVVVKRQYQVRIWSFTFIIIIDF